MNIGIASKWCASAGRASGAAGKRRGLCAAIGTDCRAKGNCAEASARFPAGTMRCGSVRLLPIARLMTPDDRPNRISITVLHRIADALERLAPPARAGQRFRRRRRLRLARRPRLRWSRCRTSTASIRAAARASTACATSCSTTPSASPPGCRPTTRCCGARAAWARARWSRPSHAAVNARAEPAGALTLIEIHREDIDDAAAAAVAAARQPSGASSCSATTSRSTRTTPATNR